MVHPILFTTGELLEFQLKGLAVKEVVDLGIIETPQYRKDSSLICR